MLLKNGRIRVGTKLEKKDILIEGNKIIKIEDHIEGAGLNLENKYVCPGLTDLHVHFREPGFEAKETIKTGSLSAAKGGYTTVFLMPNLNPVPDNIDALLKEIDIINRDAVIKCYPYASVSVREEGKEISDILNLKNKTRYFSDDGKGLNNNEVLDKAIKLAKDNNLFIASHAENYNYLPTDNRSEYEAVRNEIEIVKKYYANYHFCHLSTKESFELVKAAQDEGYKISCEVTPHHLFLNDSDINNDPNYKMNPPLRSEEDRKATLNALLSGVAKVISTDHAPHETKNKDYKLATNGIIGLETAAPLVYTNLVKTGLITFKEFEEYMSSNALALAGLPKNEIKVGSIANLCVLDIDNSHTYKESEIKSKGHNSPFINKSMYGFNTLTIYEGKIVYEKQKGEI